ncbi:MAG: ferrochelatase [Thermoplasmata archaeon]|nr:ferrochelatase [Thermoplasmata archaeon]
MNRSNKKNRIKVAIFLIMSLVMMSVDFSVGLDVEQNVKIGILMINHGEPAEYNATIYEDFKEFTQHMINVGIIPRFLMNIDTGTILIDEKNDHWAPFWKRSLIDAWGNRYKGFAFFVPGNEKMGVPPHYLKIFGKGRGEPDIFEYAGLEAYEAWQEMGGRSPYRDQTIPQMENVSKLLKKEYGDRISIRFAYGFEKGDVKEKTKELLDEDIDILIVAPQVVVGSYFEGTLHWIKEVHEALNDYVLKEGKSISFIETEPIGIQSDFIKGVVMKVKDELSTIPANANVAIFLSNHGFPLTKCGGYDCQSDPYHHYAKEIFDKIKKAIISNISWQRNLDVFQIYAESAEGDSDPENQMMSPQEGLNYTKSHGFTYIIDIPYEFLGDCMDTLIGLRESFGVEPKWNKNFESEFDIQGIHVEITSALYYHSYREKAYYHSITNEIEKLIGSENPEKSYKQNLMEQPKKNVKGAIRFLLTLGVLVAIWYYVLRKW